MLKHRSPELFESHRSGATETTLLLDTTDVARVRHEWGVLVRACIAPPYGAPQPPSVEPLDAARTRLRMPPRRGA